MARTGEVVVPPARLNGVRKAETANERGEIDMYGLAEYEAQRRRPEEIRREVAAIRLGKAAREDRETRPYVVRDLSWEFARYLDTLDS
jgi:hypothetical protein